MPNPRPYLIIDNPQPDMPTDWPPLDDEENVDLETFLDADWSTELSYASLTISHESDEPSS